MNSGLLRRARAALDQHWFAPASLTELGVVRIVVVGAQLLFFLPGLDSALQLALADDSLFLPLPALKVLMLPFGGWGIRPSEAFLTVTWVLALVSGVLAVGGLWTRPAMLCFAATNTLLIAHGYSYHDYHHPEAMMVIGLWVLAFAPVGNSVSLDRLWKRNREARRDPAATRIDLLPPPSFDARWPLRTIQWCFVLVYLSAGLSKLANGGLAWLNGYTMSYYLLMDGIRWNIPIALWLQEHIWLAAGMSVVAVVFELTFAAAVLVPRLTWLYVLIGAGLHIGIYFTLRAPFFQYLFLYIVFIETLRRTPPLGRSSLPGHLGSCAH